MLFVKLEPPPLFRGHGTPIRACEKDEQRPLATSLLRRMVAVQLEPPILRSYNIQFRAC